MSSSSSQMPGQDLRVATTSRSMPSLESLAPVLDEKPTGFLDMPRELRDKVYTYLLSTEYNKYYTEEPPLVTLRRDYRYRFHTSILHINRQINHEASHNFYMNNLFVHIFCDESRVVNFSNQTWVSRFTKGAKAQQIARHAMKIEVLSGGGGGGRVFSNQGNSHFFITNYSELPAFCRSLLQTGYHNEGSLASLKLRLIIGDEVGIDGDRAEEYEITESCGVTESYPCGRDSSIEGSLARRQNKIDTTSSRVRKLLEPFRQLHSIRDPQIIGPLSEQYKVEIVAQLSKSPPSSQHLFDHVLTTSGEATNTFDSGDFARSIPELKNTLDELADVPYLDREDACERIIIGPYAGCTIRDAYKDIEFTVWTKLAWACFKTRDVNTADILAMVSIGRFVDVQSEHRIFSQRGHDIAMLYYLESQIWEEPDCVGYRSHCLGDVIELLVKGLRHEPGNDLLKRELEKRELELAREKGIDTLIPKRKSKFGLGTS